MMISFLSSWTRKRGRLATAVGLLLASAMMVSGEDTPSKKPVPDKATSGDATSGDRFFRDEVAPIFQRSCVQCHQGDKPKGGLSLVTRREALTGGESGAAFEPGDPEGSLLLEYISGDEPEMPQGEDALPKREIDVLRRWIAGGAKWPPEMALEATWWSFRRLKGPAVPAIEKADRDWVRTPIDAFIAQTHANQGLHHSPDANRRTLIRRLYFDLIGLPPTPDEVDQFVRDPDPRAYEQLVDRLLASPHYGQRWARHWLDVVHYGDTHGYDKDKVRNNAWPYRDYVVRAFNDDKPYSRFVLEQLAGDVLYPNSRDGIVATGFIAAGPFDWVGHIELAEGSVDKKITRNLDRDDMVVTTINTFVSLTAQCARCHAHKFDPITMEDYYSLQAVFAGVQRADRPYPDNKGGELRAEFAAKKDQLKKRLKTINVRIENAKDDNIRAIEKQMADLRKERGAALASSVKPLTHRTLGYHSYIESRSDVAKWVQVDLGREQSFEKVVLLPSFVQYAHHKGPGFGFPVRYRIEASNDEQFASGVTLLSDQTAVDFVNPGDSFVAITAPKKLTARYVRITATKLWNRTDDFALALSELVVLSKNRNIARGALVMSLDSIEAGTSWGRQFLTDGMFGQTSFDQLASLKELSPSNGYHSAIEKKSDVTKWVQVDLGREVNLDRVELVPARPTDFPDSPGFGFPRRFKVEVSRDAQFNKAHVVADFTAVDFKNPGDRPVVLDNMGNISVRYIRMTASRLWKRTDDYAFALAELQAYHGEENIARNANVTALDSIETGRWSINYLVDNHNSRHQLHSDGALLGRNTRANELAKQIEILQQSRDAWMLKRVPGDVRADLASIRTAIAEVDAVVAKLPAQRSVYAAASTFKSIGNFQPVPGGKPRTIHVLKRGGVQTPGKQVGAGTVGLIKWLPSRFKLKDPSDEGQRRAALGRWIVDRENPLTWRSIVNRVWHYHFGRGIVDSPNDFGRMGTKPTHPKLIDWLAVKFRESGGSIKRLHRLIVTSSVYRQASSHDEKMAKLDSGNRFLWRMNRRRLEAEAIHDSVLRIAGELDEKMGGAGFRTFGFTDDHSPRYKYQEHDPDDPKSHRRSIYRFIVRSVPDPFMETLDCADPSLVVSKRGETLTALQALALLNNRFMVRMSEQFSQRVAKMGGNNRRQIGAAIRLAVGRDATEEELKILVDYAALHGMRNTCRVIFNMNEFIFID